MTDREVLAELLKAEQSVPPATKKELEDMGLHVGKTYTDHGLPIDMALDQLDKRFPGLTRYSKVIILNAALGWLIEHRRNSAATEKALDRQRKNNRETMRRYLESGEAGLY